MSVSNDTHEHAEEHVHRSAWFYVAIGVLLTLATLIEVAPLFEVVNIPPIGLLILTAFKFFLVVAFFMHLWDDAPIYSQLFYIPMVGAVLMVSVLMLLFHTFNPKPGEDAFAVQERYVANYRGECNSWLLSHRSNRWYCASPPIAVSRMVRVGPVGPAWGTFPGILEDMDEEEQFAALYDFGEKIYRAECASCHQADGTGTGGYPPIAGSDFLGTPEFHASIIIHGIDQPITVLGVEYPGGAMPPFSQLDDLEVAAVATYERNAWGNEEGIVLPEHAQRARQEPVPLP